MQWREGQGRAAGHGELLYGHTRTKKTNNYEKLEAVSDLDTTRKIINHSQITDLTEREHLVRQISNEGLGLPRILYLSSNLISLYSD